MPVAPEAPRCSDFARSINVLPPGTGLHLTRIVLVSVPLPWPKPALKHPLLVEAAAKVTAASVPTRLFAAEPTSEEIVVEVFERSGTGSVYARWAVPDAVAVTSVIESILTTDVGQLSDAGPVSKPVFLVCTQGSHDTCCGLTGVALANQIVQERPQYDVRRVSHTGGHRFSPTLVALPQGRMWAFVDLALLDRIAQHTESATDYQQHSRGWWGAPAGGAQVAEIAVRSELVGKPFGEPTITPLDNENARSATDFAVAVENESWRIKVSIARTFPSIACESPGGEPAKPGREFAWSISRDAAGDATVDT